MKETSHNENLQSKPNSNGFSERIKILRPEETSGICARLTQQDILDSLYESISQSVKDGKVLGFLANHQGYLEIETWMQVSKKLQEKMKSDEFKGLCWPYSEPATIANVGKQLSEREEYYDKNGMKLLPFIRESDRNHPKYKQYITKEMEINNKRSISFLRNVFKKRYGIILTPEGSINGGRKNEVTKKVNGMQPVTDYTFVNMLLEKKNIVIVPTAVSGSYHVLNSTTYEYNDQIPSWIQNNEKVMKISAREIITVESLANIENKVDYLLYNYVAPLLPPEERGHYSNSPRTNLI